MWKWISKSVRTSSSKRYNNISYIPTIQSAAVTTTRVTPPSIKTTAATTTATTTTTTTTTRRSLHFSSTLSPSCRSITPPFPIYYDSWKEHSHFPYVSQIRTFAKRGRKGAAMGHHLEKLDELAHRVAKSGKKQKGGKKKSKSSPSTTPPPTPTPTDDDSPPWEDDDFMENDDDDDEEEEEAAIPSLPSLPKTRKRMESILSSMERSFRSIRGAQPTPEPFENILVSAYDSTVPLHSIAQVLISTPSLAIITCFDPSLCTNVRDALRESPQSWNPRVDDPSTGEVQVPLPKISQETRMALLAQLHGMTERYKIRVRNVRKKAQEKVKKGKDGKLDGVSKDDAFRVGKEVDDLTQEMTVRLDEMLEKKQKTIHEV